VVVVANRYDAVYLLGRNWLGGAAPSIYLHASNGLALALAAVIPLPHPCHGNDMFQPHPFHHLPLPPPPPSCQHCCHENICTAPTGAYTTRFMPPFPLTHSMVDIQHALWFGCKEGRAGGRKEGFLWASVLALNSEEVVVQQPASRTIIEPNRRCHTPTHLFTPTPPLDLEQPSG